MASRNRWGYPFPTQPSAGRPYSRPAAPCLRWFRVCASANIISETREPLCSRVQRGSRVSSASKNVASVDSNGHASSLVSICFGWRRVMKTNDRFSSRGPMSTPRRLLAINRAAAPHTNRTHNIARRAMRRCRGKAKMRCDATMQR